MTMVRHGKRQELAEKLSDDGVCPKIIDHLNMVTKDSWSCKVYNAGKGALEIQDGQSYLPVSLPDRTCACGKWQISGVPCKHAVRAILHSKRAPVDYCYDWFSVRKYKQAYGLNVNPQPDEEKWPNYDMPTIQPPQMTRIIGRPCRNRKREEDEPRKGKRSTTVQCGKCFYYGHNNRTCKGGPTAKEALLLRRPKNYKVCKWSRGKRRGKESSQLHHHNLNLQLNITHRNLWSLLLSLSTNLHQQVTTFVC